MNIAIKEFDPKEKGMKMLVVGRKEDLAHTTIPDTEEVTCHACNATCLASINSPKEVNYLCNRCFMTQLKVNPDSEIRVTPQSMKEIEEHYSKESD